MKSLSVDIPTNSTFKSSKETMKNIFGFREFSVTEVSLYFSAIAEGDCWRGTRTNAAKRVHCGSNFFFRGCFYFNFGLPCCSYCCCSFVIGAIPPFEICCSAERFFLLFFLVCIFVIFLRPFLLLLFYTWWTYYESQHTKTAKKQRELVSQTFIIWYRWSWSGGFTIVNFVY